MSERDYITNDELVHRFLDSHPAEANVPDSSPNNLVLKGSNRSDIGPVPIGNRMNYIHPSGSGLLGRGVRQKFPFRR